MQPNAYTVAHVKTSDLIGLVLLGLVALIPVVMPWRPPADADKYLDIFKAAAAKAGIPLDLLLRVAYQESRFRQDIITGKLASSAGALGIMQIVPKWHPGVDPLNVQEAVNYAAKYLSNLREKFGTWERALAAYNWGQGNLQKFLAGEVRAVPTETKNYVSEIMRDVRA